MNHLQNSVLGQIGSLIDEINGENLAKQAAHKKKADEEAGGSGSAKTDPGGYKGKSTHPSAKADGGLQAAGVGFRAAENKEDVKKDVPANVEEAGKPTEDSDHDQIQVGTKKTSVGEDPSVERAYKGDKADPGTSHPADAEDVGEKYSSWNFPKLYKTACVKLEGVLSRVANGDQVKQAVVKTPAKAPVEQWDKDAVDQAAEAGYRLAELAAAFGSTPDDVAVVKFASAEAVVEATIAEYFAKADLVGEFLYKSAAYEEQLLAKAAAGDPMGGGMEGGGAPPPMPPMPPGGDPMGGGGAPPELGGADPAAAMGGGAPPGGEGGEGGAGGDEAVNEMANALIDSGIPVEKLIAALQGAAGGGEAPPGAEGGMPPSEMGGEDPAAAMGGGPEKVGTSRLSASDVRDLRKSAGAIATHMYGGKFRRTQPRNKQAAQERAEAAQYLSYVREVLNIR